MQLSSLPGIRQRVAVLGGGGGIGRKSADMVSHWVEVSCNYQDRVILYAKRDSDIRAIGGWWLEETARTLWCRENSLLC